jgi:hypothetical protein
VWGGENWEYWEIRELGVCGGDRLEYGGSERLECGEVKIGSTGRSEKWECGEVACGAGEGGRWKIVVVRNGNVLETTGSGVVEIADWSM